MSKIVLDEQTLRTMLLFESLTRSRVRDCMILEDLMVFVVEEADVGKAVGPGGRNVRELARVLKRKIKIVAFSSDVQQFMKNLVYPLIVDTIEVHDRHVLLSARDESTRSMLIGRGGSTLRFFESIIKRYFPIDEVKVVS